MAAAPAVTALGGGGVARAPPSLFFFCQAWAGSTSPRSEAAALSAASPLLLCQRRYDVSKACAAVKVMS